VIGEPPTRDDGCVIRPRVVHADVVCPSRRFRHRARDRQTADGADRFNDPTGVKSPSIDDRTAQQYEADERGELQSARSGFDRLKGRLADRGTRSMQERLIGAGPERVARGTV
jgi:hypothetical protein